MPGRVCWSDGGATKEFWGHLTYEDIQAADNALFGDYRFDGIHYLLIDCMNVEETLLDEDMIDVLSHTDHVANSYKRKLKLGFACSLPALTEQFMKYIGNSRALGNSWDIQLFTDLQSAAAWAKS